MFRRDFLNVFYEEDAGVGGGEPQETLFDRVKESAPKEGDLEPKIDLGDEETGRPAYVPEKFWNAEDKAPRTEAIMKSYTEMERDFKRQQQGLPEGVPKDVSGYFTDAVVRDGKVVMPEGLANKFDVKADDPALLALAEVCRENGVSTEAWEKLVPAYYKAQDNSMGPPINIDDEMARLGSNWKSVVTVNLAYLDSMLAQGTLTSEQHAMSQGVFGTYAEGMQVLNALRVAAGHEPIPVGEKEVMPKHSEEELHQMMNDEKYGTDTAFTKEVDEAFEKFYGKEPSGSSVASESRMRNVIRQDKATLKKEFKIER